MNSIDFIKLGFDGGKQLLLTLANDLKDVPTTFPTPRGGNHALWVLGHLARSEAYVVSVMIQGDTDPLPDWKSLFGGGTEPLAEADKYPAYDRVLAEFEKVRASTLKFVGTLKESDLEKRTNTPPEYAAMFGTIGLCLAMLINHQSFHTGQIADARRALGRKPIFA
jgi:hypothetical protein